MKRMLAWKSGKARISAIALFYSHTNRTMTWKIFLDDEGFQCWEEFFKEAHFIILGGLPEGF